VQPIWATWALAAGPLLACAVGVRRERDLLHTDAM